MMAAAAAGRAVGDQGGSLSDEEGDTPQFSWANHAAREAHERRSSTGDRRRSQDEMGHHQAFADVFSTLVR